MTRLALLALFLPLTAQSQMDMPGMRTNSSRLPVPSSTNPSPIVDFIQQHTGSGTALEPIATPTPMLMRPASPATRNWTLMLHGTAFLSDIQQHAANDLGADKLFSTNWLMPMAQHKLGPGLLTLRTMLSLEPATITGRFYPELFQQGETAYEQPILNGQHPHDFVMELAALYDVPLATHTILSFYLAPVGDPAIGPTAYPHRLSASEDPIAALGHHQQDSTHIAFNVLTAGLTQGHIRFEISGFHGEEPTEARWHLQPSANGTTPDSYSSRLTWLPTQNLAAQYSIAHITAPESLQPTQNQRRQTASLMYTRNIGSHHDTHSMPGMDMATPPTGTWATTLLWGQTKSIPNNNLQNSYLLESLLTLRRNAFYTRIESASRTNELLHAPIETPIGHVQAYTLGFDRTYQLAPHLQAAPGAQYTQYLTPPTLSPTYGRAPFSAVLSLHLRIAN